MKKSKKVICMLLTLALILLNCVAVGAESYDKDTVRAQLDVFQIKGEGITENAHPDDAVPFTLEISQFKMNGDQFTISGNVIRDQDNAQFLLDGYGCFIKSTVPFADETGRFTSLSQSNNELEIINISIEMKAHPSLILPENDHLANTPIIMIGLKIEDQFIYFEGALPIKNSKTSRSLELNACEAGDALKVHHDMAGELLSKAETEEEVSEIIHSNESWRANIHRAELPEEDVMLDDPEVAEQYGIDTRVSLTRAASSPVRNLPVDVMKKVGKWGSQNNPNEPTIGYSALTTYFGNGPTVLCKYLVWEFLYNKPADMPKQTEVSTGGFSGVKIIAIGEYQYVPARDEFIYWGSSAQKRIKSPSVAVALRSANQIITQEKTELIGSGQKVLQTVLDYIGKAGIPYYSKAVDIFNELNKAGNWVYQGTSRSSWREYGDTAKAQKSAYGDIVRAAKLSGNNEWLTQYDDHAYVSYTVRQPTDLTRTAGTKYVSSKYFFTVYEPDLYGAYTVCTATINQTRDRGYYVY